MSLTIIHFLTDLDHHSGGPSVSVPALCQELAALPGVRTVLAARPTPRSVEIRESPDFRLAWIDGRQQSVARVFEEARQRDPDGEAVVHLQGLWDPMYHRASRLAFRDGIPVVVSIRGMLEPWAMRHKWLKKKIAWHAYQCRNLRRASALHATSPEELVSIQRAGLASSPAFSIPNGVTPPAGLERILREIPRQPVLLFLGRLHPVKGLIPLLDAWATAAPPGWTLQLTGPDCNGHRRELESRIERNGLQNSVRLTGPVDNEGKWRTLSGASALVLPSFSENFGLVVVEALAAGIPVAASTGTPWLTLETAGAGWQVKPEVKEWIVFLQKLAETTAEERTAMGKRGQELVARDFTWPAVASRFAERYRELVAGDRNKCAPGTANYLRPPSLADSERHG